ncbi:hypothetical protein [uncultured Tateyamaria sp.]|uniref:hypothetical protein n=1 Tax=uncultured Tateyamaria sp. TaxID=455651 RepID=UPI0026388ED9|nr:hypothetical protein [uncultured Tateyamaria sp.]
MPQFLQIAAIAVATFGTGAATLSVMKNDIPDLAVPEGDWAATGALDGMTFQIHGEDPSSGAVLEDNILFRDGTFLSVDCEDYCNFDWSDYQTKEVDGVIHFTTSAICPDAPHTIVWYGTITGDRVASDVTWTTRRWYWTNQIAVRIVGKAVTSDAVSG